MSKNFFKQWNENINHLAFLRLHLLEDECKKKLASFKKAKAHLGNQLKDLCDQNTFNRLINFTTNAVSKRLVFTSDGVGVGVVVGVIRELITQ